ncbi:DNA polymerase zeta, partial [Coemansia sp. RSA 2603]
MLQTECDVSEVMQQKLLVDQTATSKMADSVTLKVQITNIDSYMAVSTSVDCSLRLPYNIFEDPLKKVPVIRIFGATPSRQRICLHVHQVWPYLYVQYDGPQSLESVREFGYQLGLSLNHAINISLHTDGIVYVAAIIPVKGIPFYGYYAGYRPFFKILLTNPAVMSRASSLLCSGAIMGRKICVYGSHLSYILQFLVDYNLYGMDWINISCLLFRSPLPVATPDASLLPDFISDSSVANEYRWVPQGMPSYLVSPAPPEKASYCELEADIVSSSIMNRLRVRERHIHHVFHEGRLGLHFGQLVHSLNTIWADENRRRVEHGLEELQPKNSQDQSELDEPLLGNVVEQGARSENTAGFSRWSNHWRMQSLLESALLADRRHILSTLSTENEDQAAMGSVTSGLDTQLSDDTLDFTATAANIVSMAVNATNDWLNTWPTCYQVDVDGNKLYHCSSDYMDRFYYISTQAGVSSQISGLVDDKVVFSGKIGTDVVSDAGSGSTQSAVPPIAVVDMDLIGTLSSKSGNFENDEVVVDGDADLISDRET